MSTESNNVIHARYILFRYTAKKQVEIKNTFFVERNDIDAVDCTNTWIRVPSPESVPFLIESCHSINIQIISDANYHLLNVVARCPRGAHKLLCAAE